MTARRGDVLDLPPVRPNLQALADDLRRALDDGIAGERRVALEAELAGIDHALRDARASADDVTEEVACALRARWGIELNEPKDGLHRGVSFDDYSAWSAVNHSKLEHFKRTPAHARHYMLSGGGEPTQAQRHGWAVHAAVLEPERFAAEFVAAPKCDRRTKEGKAVWADFQASAAGLLILTDEEMALCRELRKAVLAHPTAAELVRAPGPNEVSALWTDASGERCKARFDGLRAYMGWSVILDLKTAQDASRKAFERSIFNFGYHRQAAMYLDGAAALAPRERKFMWIVAEKEPPYCVAVYEIEDAALSMGRDEYQRHLAAYAECRRTNEWPGYPAGVDYAGLPAWAYRGITE